MTAKEIVIDLKQESADPFEFLLDVTRRGSDIVHYAGPVGETYIFNHPNDIRHVLQSQDFCRTTLIKIVLGEGILASDGEIWKVRRNRALPFFHRDLLPAFEPLIKARTGALLEKWAQRSMGGEPLDH